MIPGAAVDNIRMTITEFLEARIAEDEDVATLESEAYYERMVAECAAKRAIIKSYRSCVGWEAEVDVTTEFGVKLVSGGMVKGLELAVKHIAAAYADHPDYQQEWAL